MPPALKRGLVYVFDNKIVLLLALVGIYATTQRDMDIGVILAIILGYFYTSFLSSTGMFSNDETRPS
jgi:hypothetical protein